MWVSLILPGVPDKTYSSLGKFEGKRRVRKKLGQTARKGGLGDKEAMETRAREQMHGGNLATRSLGEIRYSLRAKSSSQGPGWCLGMHREC